MVYRSQWLMLVSGFFEPLFYLLSIGIGLNHLVGGVPVKGGYISYAVRRAGDARHLGDERLGDRHDLQHVLRSSLPRLRGRAVDALDVTDVALGELLVGVARAALYAASLSCAWRLLGDAARLGVLCSPAALLTSLAFSCLGLAACTYIRSWQDFDLVTLIHLRSSCSRTFFPSVPIPRGSARSSRSRRCTSRPRCCAASARPVRLGHAHASGLPLALAAGGLWLAARRLRVILVHRP